MNESTPASVQARKILISILRFVNREMENTRNALSEGDLVTIMSRCKILCTLFEETEATIDLAMPVIMKEESGFESGDVKQAALLLEESQRRYKEIAERLDRELTADVSKICDDLMYQSRIDRASEN